MSERERPFYKSKWFTIVMIVIFFPLGIILLWLNDNFNKNTKSIITIVVLGLIFLIVNDDIKQKRMEQEGKGKNEVNVKEDNNENKEDKKEKDIEEWLKNKSKKIIDTKQYDDRLYVDVDGESGWSIKSSVNGAVTEFSYLDRIFKDKNINEVTFQYMYTFGDGKGNKSKSMGYKFTYDRDTYNDINHDGLLDDVDTKPYLIFNNAKEYDFHPDVWNETSDEFVNEMNDGMTKIVE